MLSFDRCFTGRFEANVGCLDKSIRDSKQSFSPGADNIR